MQNQNSSFSKSKKSGLQNAGGIATLIFFITLSIIIFQSCEAPSPYSQGELLYTNFCSNCHMTDGEGLVNLIPPLNDPEYLQQKSLQMACTIRNGVKGEITVAGRKFNNEMEPVYPLNDVEITNVINYILYKWGETNNYVSHEDVKDLLDECSIIDHSRNF